MMALKPSGLTGFPNEHSTGNRVMACMVTHGTNNLFSPKQEEQRSKRVAEGQD
jgi:hypothetical protein